MPTILLLSTADTELLAARSSGADYRVANPVRVAPDAVPRLASGADLAVAITGIAGPDGGTAEKPVGLVLFALDDGTENSRVWIFNIEGGREAIQQRATMIALNLLWRYARGQEP